MHHPRAMRFAVVFVLGVVTWLTAAPALAAPPISPERAVIVGRVGDGPWTDRATEARLDQDARLAVVVLARRGQQNIALAPDGITHVVIRGKRMRTEKLEATRVQWSTVEPHGFRAKPAANGVTSEFYSNVSMDPTSFGKWLGFDSIDYFERIVAPWGTTTTIPAVVTSGEDHAQQIAGLGTVRYKVEIEIAGTQLATPGAEALDTLGLLPAVHRVSIRRGDDFLGYLSAYLLVPEVFGSAGGGQTHQTDRFTGADCADVMVGAARRMGRKVPYTNVAGLPTYANPIAGLTELDDRGMPDHEIAGVRAGDLIRIDYGGTLRHHTPRAFDHVAALWEDRSDPAGPNKGGPDGRLDGFDLVIHMGHPRLTIEPLSEQSPATIDVLRWRSK
jgi:hypothetical protein